MFELNSFKKYVGVKSGTSYVSGLKSLEKILNINIDEEVQKDMGKSVLEQISEMKKDENLSATERKHASDMHSHLKKYIEFKQKTSNTKEKFREWFAQQPQKNNTGNYSPNTIDAAIRLLESGMPKLGIDKYKDLNCFDIVSYVAFKTVYDQCYSLAEAFDKKQNHSDFRNGLDYYLLFLKEISKKSIFEEIEKIIKDYKDDFATRDKEERYKWQAVGTYKKVWNIDAPDFAPMLKSAFRDTSNLLRSGNYFPYKMITNFAEKEPETVRLLFKTLYNEELPFEERCSRFQDGFNEYYKPQNLRHYQDLHAISVYLTCEYPEKYYIYKYSVIKEFIKQIELDCESIDAMSDTEKMELLLNLYDTVLEVVEQDDELQKISMERLDDTCYQDEAFHMLTHDIIYFGSKYKSDAIYWPSLDEYNPGITVEMWQDILADRTLTPNEMLDILAKMLEIGGESTCYHMAEVYGKTHNYYNAMGSNFGKRVKDRYNLPDCYDSEYDRMRYYTIPFVGRDVVEDNKTHYSWKLRDELKEALEGMDLTVNVDGANKKEFDKNIILYGPPGTGKTYNTAIYAVAIIENKSLEEVSSEEYADIVYRYNNYKKEGKIEFTTFHQSYGYEEFIEGIKPIMNGDSDISYDVVPGIFKVFCERALTGTDISNEQQFDNAWEKLIEAAIANENKYTFTRRSGSSINAELYNQEKLRLSWNGNNNSHNDFTKTAIYKQWIEEKGIEDIASSGGKWLYTIREAIIDELKQQFDLGSTQKNTTNYIFIIDEINRGNISKILGELITLIEPTKRIGEREEMQVKLPYSQKEFGVPDNVYIIGTMNTADRSIAAIDTALRRRFSFREMLPQADVLDGIEVDGLSVSNVLKKMNRRIEVLYDRDHTIGHAYFMPLQYDNSIECFADIFKDKIIPLLQEYFYEDYEKIRLVLGDNQKTEEYQFILKEQVDETELFGEDTDVIEDAYKYSINENAFTAIEAYEKMI